MIGVQICWLFSRKPASRRGGNGNDHLCALQRCNRWRYRVPHILTDQHRKSAEARVVRRDIPSPCNKSLLVEYAVCRQKELAMHMQNRRAISKSQVRGGIVNVPPVSFIK